LRHHPSSPPAGGFEGISLLVTRRGAQHHAFPRQGKNAASFKSTHHKRAT